MSDRRAPAILSKLPRNLRLHRRDFLLGAGATLFVTACQCGDAPNPPGKDGGVLLPDGGVDPTDAGTDPQHAAFRALEQMREAVRKSPDHLAAEAERRVAAKDVEGLYLFVRDRIRTVPVEKGALGDHLKLRWGTRGTLRAGEGSMRDKAELLAELYTRAGFDAQVYRGSVANGSTFVQRALVRSPDRTFEPDATAEQIAQWQQVLGTPQSTGPRPLFNAGGDEGRALAATLLPLLPTTLEADAFSTFAPLYQPLVRVMVDTEEHFLNVTLPDLAFGETGSTVTPTPADPPVLPPPVTLSLTLALTATPDQPATLVTATIPALDLIGRSVFVAFSPIEDFKGLQGKRITDVRTFIPSLSLRAPDMDADTQQANTWVGAPFTLSGEVMQIDGDTLLIRGLPLDTSPFDPAKLAQVSGLAVTADAARFGEVRLRVSATDSAGNTVSGLPASAFNVTEDGSPQSFTLLENAPPPPRVLFVLDRSTSMPPDFRTTGAAQLLEAVATQLLAEDPRCSFRVHIIDGNLNEGAWTQDPAALAAASQSQSGEGSNLWKAMAQVSGLGASVIVMISDGDAADSATREYEAAISLAPPSLFLSVVPTPTQAMQALATLTGGKTFPVTTHAEATAEIDAFLRAREQFAYLLRYEAPQTGAQSRAVQVTLRDTAHQADTTYDVPAQPSPPGRVGGLLLSVETAGEPTLTRLLAGTRQPAPDAPEALFKEVHGALFGSSELHFEGGPPTLAAVADDALTARLGWEPVLQALNAENATYEELERAFTSRPAPYHLTAWMPHLSLPSQADEEILHRTGLRAVLASFLPRVDDTALRKLDILPLGHHRTLNTDKRRALESTLAATAHLALCERGWFQTNTAALLEGAALTHLRPGFTMGSALPALGAQTRAKWDRAMTDYLDQHRLVPTSGAPVAFWAVHPASGELSAVLESGAGGGEGPTDCGMSGTLDALETLGNFAGLTGALGAAAGTWYSLEITKARKLAAATVVIAGGTAHGSDPTDWSDFFGTAGCGGVNAALGAGAGALAGRSDGLAIIGGVAEDVLKADEIWSALGGDSVICNPPDTSTGGCD